MVVKLLCVLECVGCGLLCGGWVVCGVVFVYEFVGCVGLVYCVVVVE